MAYTNFLYLHGTLFIDEAYGLGGKGGDKFNKEVVSALLTGLENNRGGIVVILAGYRDKMATTMRCDPTKTTDGSSARSFNVMASLGNGKVLMYGGIDLNNVIVNDAWIFTLSFNGKDSGSWTKTLFHLSYFSCPPN